MSFVHVQPTPARCSIAWAGDNSGIGELDAQERREYAELAHDARRRDWLAGRRAAKRAIATHCDVPRSRVRLAGRGSAPRVALVRRDDASWNPLPLSISISHHEGCGLAAVADSPDRVGVDLACPGEIEPEHHRYFLAPSERLVAERAGATFVWALKEAAWKALALTGATPFLALELSFDGARRMRGLWLDGRWMSASARVWRLSHDMVAAAVYVGAEPQ